MTGCVVQSELWLQICLSQRGRCFSHHRAFCPASTRGFSTEVNRPGSDDNYTLPEKKLGLEVLYIYGRLRVMVSVTTFYLCLIHTNYKDNRSGTEPHHASGRWSPALLRGGPVSLFDCVPCEVSGVRSDGTGFSSNNSVFPMSVSFHQCSILIFFLILLLSEG